MALCRIVRDRRFGGFDRDDCAAAPAAADGTRGGGLTVVSEAIAEYDTLMSATFK
jgi:hypothetical protein